MVTKGKGPLDSPAVDEVVDGSGDLLVGNQKGVACDFDKVNMTFEFFGDLDGVAEVSGSFLDVGGIVPVDVR